MKEIILNFPKQFKVGLETAKKIRIRKKFNKVIVCGMGGSALPGTIFKMWLRLNKINLVLLTHSTYGLPNLADKDSLIICISYSGNTEETISSFKEVLAKKLSVIVISSGGKLEELAKKHKIPFAKIPSGIPPRTALGFQFSALFQILINCRLIKTDLKSILSLEKKLNPETLENYGKALAKKIKNRIPVIYSSFYFKELATIWKIKFNENSKIPAFANYFPELNHNEMVGYTFPNKDFYILILRDKADQIRILKRMELTSQLLKKSLVPVDFVEIKGNDIFEKIFSNILLSDWVSYYLALEKKIDPVPTVIIEEFKKRMKK